VKRKTIMEVIALLQHLRAGASNHQIKKALGVSRRTARNYRAWAESHGLLEGTLPPLAELERLRQVRLISILTAPAPNTGAVLQKNPSAVAEVTNAFRRRIAMVLALGPARDYRNLVLGAWGCGAFRGDPELVASIFAEELSGRFRWAFERVTFGVLIKSRRDRQNYAAFERAFAHFA